MPAPHAIGLGLALSALLWALIGALMWGAMIPALLQLTLLCLVILAVPTLCRILAGRR